MRHVLTLIRLFAVPLAVAVMLALFVRSTCFRLFSIPSDSMAPTLIHGDQIVVTPYRTFFRATQPRVGDVIVFRRPGHGWFVKRVIAMGGDQIEIRSGRLRRNGFTESRAAATVADFGPMTVAPQSYFVLGDNRGDSIDSRVWGTISANDIYGRARLVLWSSGAAGWSVPARADDVVPGPARSAEAPRLALTIE